MKFHTKQYEIGTEIEVPKNAVNPTVTITQDYDVPAAVLTYAELSDDELRELKLRMSRGPQGASLLSP